MSIKGLGLDPDGKFGFTDNDVVRFQSANFGLEKMTRIGDLINAMGPWARGKVNSQGQEADFFHETGSICEVLRVSGGGWQRGRFRFRLEFIPENPEAFMEVTESNKTLSPLDDLRSNLDIQPS